MDCRRKTWFKKCEQLALVSNPKFLSALFMIIFNFLFSWFLLQDPLSSQQSVHHVINLCLPEREVSTRFRGTSTRTSWMGSQKQESSFYPFAKRFCTLVAKGCNNVGVKFQFNIYNRTRDKSDWKKLTKMGDTPNVVATLYFSYFLPVWLLFLLFCALLSIFQFLYSFFLSVHSNAELRILGYTF